MYWAADYRDSYTLSLWSETASFNFNATSTSYLRPLVINGKPSSGRLHPSTSNVRPSSRAFYVPGGNFAVDKTMIRFQGRSLWITIIKSKPEPMGYRIFTVASDGYLLGFRIFRGKGGMRPLSPSFTVWSSTWSSPGEDTTGPCISI